MANFLIASSKPWTFVEYKNRFKNSIDDWRYIDKKEKLDKDYLKILKPKYIFFPHWSWIVPEDILKKYECICFHMTDLPFGRGGSPLQNLIKNGYDKTKISALKMTPIVDSGPIYLKRDLDLSGTAQNIYERSTKIIYDMMEEIISNDIAPTEQIGEVKNFKRLSDNDNLLPEFCLPREAYNHIRMLDAETYPKAFIKYGSFKIEFFGAKLGKDDTVTATVIIREEKNGK